MADLAILRDINETLKKLLQENIPELSGENSIIFDSPGEIEESNTTRLTAFLYHIMENSQLRNSQPSYPEFNKRQYAPLTLDLYYMFVPYAHTRENEIIVMERLLRTLYDNAVLRPPVLQGNLEESGNDEIRVVPHTLSLDDLNKLWSTFPNKAFKLSKSYIITPVRIPSARTATVSRVTEKIVSAIGKS